ncbi:histidine phosphatase family protein [Sphingomonas sp. FW199]|uniref:histidine phosphatase family protein n=1 Tax=Sphingomonas sp. FW199 TaxID=3400217 RepID=UPI003CF9B817
MSAEVLLVRHTAVALAWRGRCYGASDVPLSRQGRADTIALAAVLAERNPVWVVHSGLARTRILAERIARACGCPTGEDRGWRERDFGSWEGQRWTAIYRATGNAMDGMIDTPDSFRPGGGETTFELADRVALARQRLPGGRGIVVTHGGPIAALIGRDRGALATDWPALVPPCGGSVVMPGEWRARQDSNLRPQA